MRTIETRLACAIVIGCAAGACSGARSPGAAHDADAGLIDDGGFSEVRSDTDEFVDAASDSGSNGTLCNGAATLRLWVLVEPIYSRELPGSQLRVENGSPFIAIDGECAYWIGGGWTPDPLARDREIRSGLLDSVAAAAIEHAVKLDDLAPLEDCVAAGGSSDISVRSIQTALSGVRCGSKGVLFDQAWSALETLAMSLWQNGRPLDGDIHIGAVVANQDTPGGAPPYVWPLPTPLGSYLLPPGKDGSNLFMPAISMVVRDPASTEKLRTLRARYLADREAAPGRYTNWDALRTTDGATTAFVYMRDAIPNEAVNGLLRF